MVRIAYKSSVGRDLRLIDKTRSRSLLDRLEESLGRDPDAGEPLKGEFRGLYKLRIGDYRVIYTKTSDGLLVLKIGHRSKVYGS